MDSSLVCSLGQDALPLAISLALANANSRERRGKEDRRMGEGKEILNPSQLLAASCFKQRMVIWSISDNHKTVQPALSKLRLGHV